MIVTWGGAKFDKRTSVILTEVDRETIIPIKITQGSYNTSVSASGGTHAKGGAGDVSTTFMTEGTALKLVKVMRQNGLAAYLRPRTRRWSRHIHFIAIQPGGRDDKGVLSDPAWEQVKEYYDGGDGLVGSYSDPHKNMNVEPITFEEAHAKSSFPLPVGESYGVDNHNGKGNATDSKNIKLVQKRLSISQTGIFGPVTRAKVIAWQIWKRLKPTGRVGKATWDKMFPVK